MAASLMNAAWIGLSDLLQSRVEPFRDGIAISLEELAALAHATAAARQRADALSRPRHAA
jgi:hypothetical protein